MRPRSMRTLALLGLAGLAGATTVAAQTTDEINSGIQLNFTPPGARSLGMGGAFVAVATDATAAVSNPAGLTQLDHPEISIELLASDFTHSFVDRGHAFGPVTGNGIDTVDGLITAQESDQTVGASFVSAVFRHKDKPWTLAAYRHELANFRANYRRSGPFLGPWTLPDGSVWPRTGQPARTRPTIMSMDLQIDSYGLAGAIDLVEDRLTLGIGVAMNDFSIESATQRFSSREGRLFEEADFSPENLRVTQVQSGSDIGFSFSAGYLWRLTDKLALGGVIRLGPEFDYEARRIQGPQSDPEDTPATFGATFHVPDRIGFGIAYELTSSVNVAFEWDRVEYSKLTDELTNPFASTGPETLDTLAGRASEITVEDGSEYHLGVEWRLNRDTQLWFGAWLDPEHRFAVRDPQTAADQRAAALFRPGDDEIHVSAGIGHVFDQLEAKGRSFSLDAAIDVSEFVSTLTISTTMSFPGLISSGD